MEREPLSLENLYGGAAIEAFDHELKAVLENIADINTQPDALRKITLEVKIKPTKERNLGRLTFQVKSAQAPAQALETDIIIDNGKAAEMFKGQNPEQHTLPGSTPVSGNVVHMNDHKSAAAGE
ncbi:MAG: hypothetical protein ACNI27_08580 [Desulfovibrio sp.]